MSSSTVVSSPLFVITSPRGSSSQNAFPSHSLNPLGKFARSSSNHRSSLRIMFRQRTSNRSWFYWERHAWPSMVLPSIADGIVTFCGLNISVLIIAFPCKGIKSCMIIKELHYQLVGSHNVLIIASPRMASWNGLLYKLLWRANDFKRNQRVSFLTLVQICVLDRTLVPSKTHPGRPVALYPLATNLS